MDLRKVSDEDKLTLCKKYYYGGFALLPFLWLINGVWFFKHAFMRTSFPQQKQMRQYVIRSLIGSLLWAIGLISWIAIFQMNRVKWGVQGDDLSFVIPKGRP